MREIKFRAYDSFNKEMYFITEDINCITVKDLIFGNLELETLMQYTGLKDKNGVEIYEGDIVKNQEYPFFTEEGLNYVGIVCWCEEGLVYFLDLKAVSSRVAGGACGEDVACYEELEVTGNIHENPDLLEDK